MLKLSLINNVEKYSSLLFRRDDEVGYRENNAKDTHPATSNNSDIKPDLLNLQNKSYMWGNLLHYNTNLERIFRFPKYD